MTDSPRDKIRKALANGPLDKYEIRNRTGIPSPCLWRILSHMVDTGYLDKEPAKFKLPKR